MSHQSSDFSSAPSSNNVQHRITTASINHQHNDHGKNTKVLADEREINIELEFRKLPDSSITSESTLASWQNCNAAINSFLKIFLFMYHLFLSSEGSPMELNISGTQKKAIKQWFEKVYASEFEMHDILELWQYLITICNSVILTVKQNLHN